MGSRVRVPSIPQEEDVMSSSFFIIFFALKFGDSKKKRTFATHLRGGLNVEWCGSSAG